MTLCPLHKLCWEALVVGSRVLREVKVGHWSWGDSSSPVPRTQAGRARVQGRGKPCCRRSPGSDRAGSQVSSDFLGTPFLGTNLVLAPAPQGPSRVSTAYKEPRGQGLGDCMHHPFLCVHCSFWSRHWQAALEDAATVSFPGSEGSRQKVMSRGRGKGEKG